MKIGVISNPRSRRNRSLQSKVDATLARSPDIVHEHLYDFGSLNDALGRLAQAGVELLVINGGDGTVGAVVTEIFVNKAFRRTPLLAVLPGGTSNTIAGDVGLRGNPIGSLERLLATEANGFGADKIVSRALIRIDYAGDRPPVCGFFFGTAAICDATLLRRRLFPQRWLPDALAAAMTLVGVLAGAALGRPGVLSGQDIGVELNREARAVQAYTVLIVTTLNRILLGSFPFWGSGEGALKLTSIGAPAAGIVRHAYRLLYGRDRSKLPKSTYFSANAARVELHMDCPFNLDGEFYQPVNSEAVILSCPYTAEFLRC